eukprot:1156901-Pelagomonas_calceolata.AAC.4
MGKLQRLDILNASGQGMLADADAASISPAARVTSMAASLIECDMKQKAWNIGREPVLWLCAEAVGWLAEMVGVAKACGLPMVKEEQGSVGVTVQQPQSQLHLQHWHRHEHQTACSTSCAGLQQGPALAEGLAAVQRELGQRAGVEAAGGASAKAVLQAAWAQGEGLG